MNQFARINNLDQYIAEWEENNVYDSNKELSDMECSLKLDKYLAECQNEVYIQQYKFNLFKELDDLIFKNDHKSSSNNWDNNHHILKSISDSYGSLSYDVLERQVIKANEEESTNKRNVFLSNENRLKSSLIENLNDKCNSNFVEEDGTVQIMKNKKSNMDLLKKCHSSNSGHCNDNSSCKVMAQSSQRQKELSLCYNDAVNSEDNAIISERSSHLNTELHSNGFNNHSIYPHRKLGKTMESMKKSNEDFYTVCQSDNVSENPKIENNNDVIMQTLLSHNENHLKGVRNFSKTNLLNCLHNLNENYNSINSISQNDDKVNNVSSFDKRTDYRFDQNIPSGTPFKEDDMDNYEKQFLHGEKNIGALEKINCIFSPSKKPSNFIDSSSQSSSDILEGDRPWEQLYSHENVLKSCHLIAENNLNDTPESIDMFIKECLLESDKSFSKYTNPNQNMSQTMEKLKEMLFTVQTMVPNDDDGE